SHIYLFAIDTGLTRLIAPIYCPSICVLLPLAPSKRVFARAARARCLRQRPVVRLRRVFFESLEPRALLAVDFGDAPDMGAGTGAGNYQTLLADNGPRHDITTTQTSLFL